ncbi:hypothetical protein [uncultured Azohydromonas sp.]|jgi:hypothetical protein|uniref:hypothetical protein n=1 Tax=uncultured Azohydromonas sp. TaxID=487342 RepID=UPI0026212C61|nr:hypothetical protein [uncultured Azohydromonas sp.]
MFQRTVSCHRSLSAALVALALSSPVLAARELFFDDFNTLPGSAYQTALPTAPWRFAGSDSNVAQYIGPSQAELQILDGATVLRMNDLMGNAQRKGWSTDKVFDTAHGLRLEVRFNTMVQSPATAIDQLLELWLIDSENIQHYAQGALLAPDYGRQRVFSAITSQGGGTEFPFEFQDNTWYRFSLEASRGGIILASVEPDTGPNKFITIGVSQLLPEYQSGVRFGFSQSIGLPGTPSPTDVAIDYVRVTTAPIPEPGSFSLYLAGLVAILLKFAKGCGGIPGVAGLSMRIGALRKKSTLAG